MSHLPLGLIGTYNSLTDKHLTAYFNNARIRRHLQRVGLISRSGRIVSEKEFRYKIIHKDQQRHIRECLAQAIFHRVLDMERLHQTEIRRKLEEFARRERVNKMKVERCNRYEDDPLLLLPPRPPTRLRSSHTQHSGPEREPSDSTDSLSSSRPNTAPEKTQRPVRLKPLNSNSTPTSMKRNSSRYHNNDSTNAREQPISCVLDRDVMRHLTQTDFSSAVSPYRLPVINNFVTPEPPLKKKDKSPNGTLRGRRLRPATAPTDVPGTKESGVQRAWPQSAVLVKMVYFGKSVHLSHNLMEMKDEVKVFQQHCGGENLCVYKGRLKEGESFQFVSRRHRGFPFSLTFYLNGLQVKRLSSCCEFKHRRNSRLGGRHAHFGFSGVEDAAPCYRCIIAMGLDKKPTPPKRIRNDPLIIKSWENEEEEEKHFQSESSQSQRTESKRSTNHEQKHKTGYEEDFEADDEGPMEDGVDRRNETSPSLSREEKDENENEDLNRNKRRGSSSISSGMSSSLSSSEKDEDEFDEKQKDEEMTPKQHTATLTSEKDAEETEVLQISSVFLPTEVVTQSQEMKNTEQKDKEAEESKEEPRETKEPSDQTGKAEEHANEPEQAEEPRKELRKIEEPKGEPAEAGKARQELKEAKNTKEKPGEAEKVKENLRKNKSVDVNKEEDQAKSVQEKLAKAILNMTECVSEPELSDTTTEEDELVSVQSQHTAPGAEYDSNVAQRTLCEKNLTKPVQGAEGEEAHTEEPKKELEKETHETPQPETKTEGGKIDTNQTEVKTQNTTEGDEHPLDKQKKGDEKNEDQKPKVKQDTTSEEEDKTQEDIWFTNEEIKSNEEPQMMEKLKDEEPPEAEVTQSEETFGQKTEKEATSKSSLNAGETRATPEEKEVTIMEEFEKPEEKSMDPETMDKNSEIEKVNDEALSGGEEVCAEDEVSEEIKAGKKETFTESRNLRNNSEETGNDIREFVEEEKIDDTELELKDLVNEVKDKDVAGKDVKSEDKVKVSEPEEKNKKQREDGVQIDVRKDNTEKENEDEKKINQEMAEDTGDQKEPTITDKSSEEKAKEDMEEREGKQEKKLAAQNNAELKDEQTFGSEGKDTEDQHEEEKLKENTFLKEIMAEKNEVDDMSKGREERIDVGEETMHKIVMQQEEDNKEDQKNNSDLTVHKALLETTDGPKIKLTEIKAETREEIITVDQEELDKNEEARPGKGKGTSETTEKEKNGDMTKEEGVKDIQIDYDNEKEEEKQRLIQEKTTSKEEEEEEEQQNVSEKEFEQNGKQEPNNDKEVKDEQKDEVENLKPIISENSHDGATEASLETKTPAEEPKDMNIDLESRNKEAKRAGDGSHLQSSTDIKKDKSVDAAEDSRSVEASTSPSEESQPLEKVLALKREEREAELIIAPQTDHEELVSNWLNVHQASNYFETFVEPLDDIKILDGERTLNTEAPEIDKTIPTESHENEQLSEKISLAVNGKLEELEDMIVENFDVESEALGAESQRNPFSSNPSLEKENQRQIDSDQIQVQEDQEDVNNAIKYSAASLMKFEISQDS